MTMPTLVYVNGVFTKAAEATISIFDRGLLFGDSIYEVIPVYDGHPYFVDAHLKRLESNLAKARIAHPEINWSSVFSELIEGNGGGDLQLYLQITRGNQGIRKHDIPAELKPSVIAYTLHTPFPSIEAKQRGLHAKLIEDTRWLRCDIKTTSLLGNILLNDEALLRNADTALLSRDGYLTEGSAANVFVVDSEGRVCTPPLDNFCLPGITRQITLDLLKNLSIPFYEEKIPSSSIFNAREVWITGTTKEIYPVTRINDSIIADGCGGPYWQQLNTKYQQLVRKCL